MKPGAWDSTANHPTFHEPVQRQMDNAIRSLRRPSRCWINLLLTLLIIAGMTVLKLEPVAVFMVGVVLALQINYPQTSKSQRANDH